MEKNKKELEPFDRLLVRYREEDPWQCAFFSNMVNKRGIECVHTTGSFDYPYWIRYKGNEQLWNTTKKL